MVYSYHSGVHMYWKLQSGRSIPISCLCIVFTVACPLSYSFFPSLCLFQSVNKPKDWYRSMFRQIHKKPEGIISSSLSLSLPPSLSLLPSLPPSLSLPLSTSHTLPPSLSHPLSPSFSFSPSLLPPSHSHSHWYHHIVRKFLSVSLCYRWAELSWAEQHPVSLKPKGSHQEK